MSEHENGTSLGLDEVVRRFADSERALDEARARLEALASAEATQTAAARGLDEASAATREFVEAARALVSQAEETQRTAREVLQAGASLIDGTDLKELESGLTSTSHVVKAGFERVEQLIGDVGTRDQRIAKLESELARCTGALTGRQKKKLGIQ